MERQGVAICLTAYGQEETEMDFRKNIKELMKEKNITVAKLARAADLNYGTVYYFLKGESEMTSANLVKLFSVLGE